MTISESDGDPRIGDWDVSIARTGHLSQRCSAFAAGTRT